MYACTALVLANQLLGAGVDYASGPYNITFPASVTTIQFKVSLTDDHIMEQDENFILNITQSLLPDGVTIGDPGVTVVTIVDNDRKLQ